MTATITTLPHYFPEIFLNRIIISVIIFAVFCIAAVMLYKLRVINKTKFYAAILLSLYIVVLFYFTVVGRYSHEEYKYQVCIFHSYLRLVEHFDYRSLEHIVINLAMLVPVGFFLPVILDGKAKYVIALALCLLLTMSVETMQLFLKCGTFEIDDIINNMVGAIIGVLIYLLIHWIAHQKMYKGKHYE